MRILILVNTLTSVSPFVYSNHINFFVKSTKTDPTLEFFFFTPSRMAIDTARNQAAKLALELECHYLMFIDDDVLIPANTLEILLRSNKDVVAGLVIIRGMPFNNMAFRFAEDGKLDYYNNLPLKDKCEAGHINYDINCDSCLTSTLAELVEVAAVGFSCCLIDINLIKALEPPYFVTGVSHTEDIYFCMKCRELEPKPEIFINTTIQCGHLLNAEPVEWKTKKKLQEFYKESVEKSLVRNSLHIEKCLAKLS